MSLHFECLIGAWPGFDSAARNCEGMWGPKISVLSEVGVRWLEALSDAGALQMQLETRSTLSYLILFDTSWPTQGFLRDLCHNVDPHPTYFRKTKSFCTTACLWSMPARFKYRGTTSGIWMHETPWTEGWRAIQSTPSPFFGLLAWTVRTPKRGTVHGCSLLSRQPCRWDQLLSSRPDKGTLDRTGGTLWEGNCE